MIRKKTRRATKRMLVLGLGLCFLAGLLSAAAAAEPGDAMARNFASPPDSARPHTWWHWLNGNVTKEGITADLESMQRAGIGGFQLFNVSEGIPEGPVAVMSPQWLDLVRHTAAEADRLGLELCIMNCPGWSNSGGPWIKPEHAMQTVVISETQAQGPSRFDAALPQPATNADFYRDIAVLAFPTPSRKVSIEGLAQKALMGFEYQYGMNPDPKEIPAAAVVARKEIIDLTSRMGTDGKLTWEVPEGNWTILRIGHTPTGKTNHPAPPSGTGLECDKLSREAMDAHWAGGIEPILKHLGPLAGKSLNNCLIDSYEVGDNNWTPRFREEFIRRCGYDPLPFLPVLSGRYVDGGEVTERFLWDFRRTIGDLFAENYYGRFSELCRQHGLQASFEPYDGPFECLQAGATADVVMGEFWVSSNFNDISNSVKLAASIGHTHGIRYIGAESFTAAPANGRWLNHPGSLKLQGDYVWSMGVNRFIFHTYAHQPWKNVSPGMTMGQWGTRFGRTNTWWEQSRPWMDYLARSQYLLQQGRCAADVLFFGGEASPNGNVYRPDLKAKGYDYDAMGTDLIPSLSVDDGRITTPAGGSYRMLVLPETTWMTPKLARKVGELVRAGGIVLAPKPEKSPSLSDYPACDEQLRKIADEVWGETPGDHKLGKGRVISGRPVEEVLAMLGVKPDCTALHSESQPAFIHRIAQRADLYFVSNQKRLPETMECAFPVAGRLPELWDPETGRIQPAPQWRVEDGRTIVTLNFEPAGSVFVVFRQAASPPADPIVKIARQDGEDSAFRVPKLEIRRAVYGDFTRPDGGKVDVTSQLAARVKDGCLSAPVSNDLAGDPAVNVIKELQVEYALDGAVHSATFREYEVLQLPPEDDPLLLQPRPRLFLEDGRLSLLAPKAGRYVLTTASGKEKTVTVDALPDPEEQTGSWEVTFPADRGAPAGAVFDRLISWSDHPDAGIKYFSGAATYRKTINVPAACLGKNRRLLLDLGRVKEIAEVRLNGRDLGILWKTPFRVDVTKAARAGENELEVRVTNLWPNRLIGDEQLPEDCQWNGVRLEKWPEWFLKGESRPVPERRTFTTWKQWYKDSPLLPSGLLGPVVLRTLEQVPVE
ncbi:MAG: hypothetical protein JXB10_09775 [Pirellulales bacterium]|nr:hypothetical protein [Pirellulales bacterium]